MSDVTIVEVGPRDGLQNEAAIPSTATKIALVERLARAGFPVVEAGAFVSPKWVPQMADTAAVFAGVERIEGVAYPVLVPNMKGYEAAREAGADHVAVFAAASETFSAKNINCTIAESLERFAPVFEAAKADGVRVRAYVSCVLGCPYEGEVAISAVVDVAKRLYQAGAYEVSLGDTIGVGAPLKTRALVQAIAGAIPVQALAGHFHDTYGQALANIWAAYDLGVRTFDASVAGLGGCPYAKGASGNAASEDVAYSFEKSGVETGIDLDALLSVSRWISETLDRPPASKLPQTDYRA